MHRQGVEILFMFLNGKGCSLVQKEVYYNKYKVDGETELPQIMQRKKVRTKVREQKLGLKGSDMALVCPKSMHGLWEQAVEQVKKELYTVLGDVICDVQEVGTGAIRNTATKVYCKPIIDLAVSVRSITAVQERLPLLHAAGYIHRFKRDTDNRLFFIKRTPSGEHTHHIYVLKESSPMWEDLIHFRDYLSMHPEKLKKYIMIKQDLVSKYPHDRNLYNRSRSRFMHSVARESNEFFTLGKEMTVENLQHISAAYSIGRDAELFAKTGQEATVYVLGDARGDKCTGHVVAMVHTPQTEQDLCVVALTDKIYYEPEIEHILQLQQKDSRVSYTCSHEKSCGAVLFTEEDGERKYLLIKNRSLHAGFPKGHIEYGETELETVQREIGEETGLSVEIIPGFREAYDYRVRSFIQKTAVYYLACFSQQTIVPQEGEVLDYWMLPLDEALDRLGFEQDRVILQKAHAYLQAMGR